LHISLTSSLAACLTRWAAQLSSSTDTPQLDAEVLFKHVSEYSAVELITRADEALDRGIISAVERLIAARTNGMPVAYLTGQREFYSLPLRVSPAVLIPRPDTECLVEVALARIKSTTVQRVLDLGTGSGAIALALAKNALGLDIVATDRKSDALELAEQNASQLDISGIRFLLSDWYQALPGQKFDLIVSNPPYIDPLDPHLQQGDLRFEPHGALAAAEHGLADLRQIIGGAPAHLNAGGALMVEHGYDQAESVQALMQRSGFICRESRKDYGGNDRVTIAQLPPLYSRTNQP